MKAVLHYLKANQPRFIRRTVRAPAFPQHLRPAAAQAGPRRLRGLARAALPADRPQRRIVPDTGPSDRARPHAPPGGAASAFPRLRPLRRAAAGAVRPLGFPALRAGHSRPKPGRPRLRRQQGPAFRPSQGGGSLPPDRHQPAVRSHVRARRRGGGRQPQPAAVFLRQRRRELRCDCGGDLRHQHACEESAGAHLRAAGRRRASKSPCAGRPATCIRASSAARSRIRRWRSASCSRNCATPGAGSRSRGSMPTWLALTRAGTEAAPAPARDGGELPAVSRRAGAFRRGGIHLA